MITKNITLQTFRAVIVFRCFNQNQLLLTFCTRSVYRVDDVSRMIRYTRDKNRKLSEKQQQTICGVLLGRIIVAQEGLRVTLAINSIISYQ